MDRLPPTRYDYVAVGHVTRDVLEHGADGAVAQPGGSAFYSALQAARLGLRTLILTQGVPEEIETLLAPYLRELELHVIAAPHTTTLSTRGTGTQRTQRMLAWAGAIVDRIELHTAILHFAPVARETPTTWSGDAEFVGVTPQGLVRHWARDGAAEVISAVDLDPALLPERFDAAAISEHEHLSCQALFPAAQRHGACVAVTAGSHPTTIHMPHDGEANLQVTQTAIPVVTPVRDDLGAGDVFAAAFFVALTRGRDPLDAARYGNAAAAVRIAGMGPGAIGDQAHIEELLV